MENNLSIPSANTLPAQEQPGDSYSSTGSNVRQQESFGDLISDELNDVISHRPNALVRYGVSIIAAVVIFLLSLTWFIRYPDIIKTPLSIVALHTPKKVLARSEGKLQKILIENNAMVKVKEPMAFIQSTGDHAHILKMKEWLEEAELEMRQLNWKGEHIFPLPMPMKLGELQQAYHEFQITYQEAEQTIGSGYYRSKLNALVKDGSFLQEQYAIMEGQMKIAIEDFEIQKREFDVKEKLANQHFIAPQELAQEKSKLLAKSSLVESMESRLLDQRMQLHNKGKDIRELEKVIGDVRNKSMVSLLVFKSKVEEWINIYIVLSPENGKVQFMSSLQENQHVKTGQELFYVEPVNNSFYGEIISKQAGLGKVMEGQSVIIRFDSYPSTEFGYITGRIESISPVLVKDSSYLLYVSLPAKMQTNYNRVIPIKNNMSAQAEIITQNRRLLLKLFAAGGEMVRQ